MAADGVANAFAEMAQNLEGEQERRDSIRAVVKTLEVHGRRMLADLQRVHSKGANEQAIVAAARGQFGPARDVFEELRSLVPAELYYKYSGMWSRCTQDMCFMAAFVKYLEDGSLIDIKECEELLGLESAPSEDNPEAKFFLSIEDYLLGVCALSNELSRLCVNSVTNDNFARPNEIAAFLNSLYSGFRLLNLKNDILRKRMDSIKYDVRKIEGVVYDLSIRGLLKADADTPMTTAEQ